MCMQRRVYIQLDLYLYEYMTNFGDVQSMASIRGVEEGNTLSCCCFF